MDSVDKLRKFRNTPDFGYWAGEITELADEIEREIAERYMELPVDADGVPIHVGDELCGYGLPNGGAVVKALNGRMVIVGRLDGGENYAKSGLLWDARETHHVKSRMLEDVLREMVGMTDQPLCEEDIKAFADEIRELLSKAGD